MKKSFGLIKEVLSIKASWILMMLIAIISFGYMTTCYKAVTAADAMYPTYTEGQKLIIKKESDFDYGDIVAYKSKVSDAYIIRRVIALPGDSVLFTNHKLYVNGAQIEEPYVLYADDKKEPYLEDIMYTVGYDEYFLCGDNRNFSVDSRVSGSIKGSEIFGVVIKEIK